MLEDFADEELERARLICPECVRYFEIVNEMIEELKSSRRERFYSNVIAKGFKISFMVGSAYLSSYF